MTADSVTPAAAGNSRACAGRSLLCQINPDVERIMSKQKYTKWFDPVTQPPVRVGWYEVDSARDARRYWNGTVWSIMCHRHDDDDTCAKRQILAAVWLVFKWRGLTEPHPDYKAPGAKP